MPLTPFLASLLPIQRNASRGLISPDRNNFAPRIGFAYRVTNKLVMRAGYGIFYGGQENGPFSNPSPGFNPPFYLQQTFQQTNCFDSSANPAQEDCSIPNLNVLANGYPASSLSDPNNPQFYSLSPKLRTPYNQQWHFGLQYQLPGDTVLEASYAGSRGLKLYGFFKTSIIHDSSSPQGNDFPLPLLAADTGPNGSPEFHVRARGLRLAPDTERSRRRGLRDRRHRARAAARRRAPPARPTTRAWVRCAEAHAAGRRGQPPSPRERVEPTSRRSARRASAATPAADREALPAHAPAAADRA